MARAECRNASAARHSLIVFSHEERTKIEAAVEKVLLSLKHPRMSAPPNFSLTVWGTEYGSAIIEPSWRIKPEPRHEFKKAADGACAGCAPTKPPIPVGGVDYLSDLL